MTYQELLKEAGNLKILEARARLEHYFEIVLAKPELEAAEALLRSYFGEPIKPRGQPVSPEIAAQARAYGGVRADQTMYFHPGPNGGEFAFLWPWSDGRSITCKIMTAKK